MVKKGEKLKRSPNCGFAGKYSAAHLESAENIEEYANRVRTLAAALSDALTHECDIAEDETRFSRIQEGEVAISALKIS